MRSAEHETCQRVLVVIQLLVLIANCRYTFLYFFACSKSQCQPPRPPKPSVVICLLCFNQDQCVSREYCLILFLIRITSLLAVFLVQIHYHIVFINITPNRRIMQQFAGLIGKLVELLPFCNLIGKSAPTTTMIGNHRLKESA